MRSRTGLPEVLVAMIAPLLVMPPVTLLRETKMLVAKPVQDTAADRTAFNVDSGSGATARSRNRSGVEHAAADRAMVDEKSHCRSGRTHAWFSRRDRPGVRDRARHGRAVDHDRGRRLTRGVRDGRDRLVREALPGSRRSTAEKKRRDRGGRQE
jgi:hypothetical protein